MEVSAIQRPVDASNVSPENLAGNTALTQKQKIAEASRQFEAVLLRQILGDAQKTVFKSEFSDDSTAGGIYHDMVTNVLADSMSKSGGLGLAKVFEQQLTPSATGAATGNDMDSASTTNPSSSAGQSSPASQPGSANHSSTTSHPAAAKPAGNSFVQLHRPLPFSAQMP